MKEIIHKIIESWAIKEGNVTTTKEILEWVEELNRNAEVSITECEMDDNSF